jgi:hypothetical protein
MERPLQLQDIGIPLNWKPTKPELHRDTGIGTSSAHSPLSYRNMIWKIVAHRMLALRKTRRGRG